MARVVALAALIASAGSGSACGGEGDAAPLAVTHLRWLDDDPCVPTLAMWARAAPGTAFVAAGVEATADDSGKARLIVPVTALDPGQEQLKVTGTGADGTALEVVVELPPREPIPITLSTPEARDNPHWWGELSVDGKRVLGGNAQGYLNRDGRLHVELRGCGLAAVMAKEYTAEVLEGGARVVIAVDDVFERVRYESTLEDQPLSLSLTVTNVDGVSAEVDILGTLIVREVVAVMYADIDTRPATWAEPYSQSKALMLVFGWATELRGSGVIGQVQLVARTSTIWQHAGVCHSKNLEGVPIDAENLRAAVTVAIYEARTGKKLASTEIRGGPPSECPEFYMARIPRVGGRPIPAPIRGDWPHKKVDEFLKKYSG